LERAYPLAKAGFTHTLDTRQAKSLCPARVALLSKTISL
jgi:hypothetical protein